MLFNKYVAVDWSAASKPKQGKDSIWIAICDRGEAYPGLDNPSTRHEAIKRIVELLNASAAEQCRLFLGFDFAFGYPKGTAQALTKCNDAVRESGNGWEAIWKLLAEVIKDGPDNNNNRFDAAAQLNKHIKGEGPFWGNLLKRDIVHLPRKKPRSGWRMPPHDLRHTDRLVPKAQEVWKLIGAGNVGGQTLTGIAALERLRRCRQDLQVWPFETLGEGQSHVLAEIYPSMIEPCPGHTHNVRDARQVAAMAVTLRELDRQGKLASYLRAPSNTPCHVTAEEGFILGAHDQADFRAVAAQAKPRC